MREVSEACISITETAYAHGVGEEDWLRQVLEASAPILDDDMGVVGIWGTRSSTPERQGQIHQIQTLSASKGFISGYMQACRRVERKIRRRRIKTGLFHIAERLEGAPEQFEIWRGAVGTARDAIGIVALDTDGRGIQLLAPLREIARPGRKERRRFAMIAAHLSAGLRLRAALASESEDGSARSELPLGADAVLEPSDSTVVEAAKGARGSRTIEWLRAAAVAIDKARGPLRQTDPDAALEAWCALVRGRWSMVDWFDSDQRRYVLALRNRPQVSDPRGLTERESQVVAYAALGESHKMIAYRLGISRPTATNALRSAMRKLGVRTQAQLVQRYMVLQGRRSKHS